MNDSQAALSYSQASLPRQHRRPIQLPTRQNPGSIPLSRQEVSDERELNYFKHQIDSPFICQDATPPSSLEIMPAPDQACWRRFLPPFHSDTERRRLASCYCGRTVLVTGAAGCIGSALARALSHANLEHLLLLDCAEGDLLQLANRLGSVTVEVLPGNITDSEFLESLFSRHRVDIIFHTAAWKHVPLLESQPFSAVHNNALGTYVLARAAFEAGAPKFVLVSTDKAVNPRSIMGASKRIAELSVVSMSAAVRRMNAVRLCNVIGSSGSVVPIFLQQIEKRQAVTVTDPLATRWFITLDEAIDAILAGGLTAEHGKILLPQVGDPVSIGDLARFLIQSADKEPRFTQAHPAGAWPGEVKYIGLRPGEKLTEELMLATERQVALERAFTVVETPAPKRALNAVMDELGACITRHDLIGLLRTVQSVVPEYEPSADLLEQAAAAVRP